MIYEVGDLSEMRTQNPYFDVQLRVWQKLRRARGEDPADWDAFRAHQLEIGAWDPGMWPPEGFGGQEVKDHG